MKLSFKEIDAIRWILETQKADLGSCDVKPWRDEADVGWLLVTIWVAKRGTADRIEVEFKVSPLGHVYKHKLWAMWADWDDQPIRVGPGGYSVAV